MDRPTISVIIVSYNVRDLLENCLHSLQSALAGIPSEVVVVDNNSADTTVEMLSQHFGDVRLIRNTVNHGFAKANNQGLSVTSGEYILLLNPDTLVQEDTIRVMLDFFRAHPEAGMAGCKILNPDGAIELACRRSFPSPWVALTKLTGLSALFPKSSWFSRYNLTFLDENQTYEVDAISGSFMMLRRGVVDQIGGLDETFFMYGEDLDWCYRIQQSGWKIYYVHETKIIHYGGESTRRSSIDADAVFYHAMEVFAQKNLRLSRFAQVCVSVGIKLRLGIRRLRAPLLSGLPMILDALTGLLTVLGAEYIRLGGLLMFPPYAYPTVYVVPVLVLVLCVAIVGGYSRKEYRVLRAMSGVVLSFFVLSTLTYFFNEYAFSRIIVAVASAMNFILLPGLRMVASFFLAGERASFLHGRPTLFVGTGDGALASLARLPNHSVGTYHILGLIDPSGRTVGKELNGFRVIGSPDNIGKLIVEHGVTDVIFAPEVLSFTEILGILGKTHGRPVRYHLVPKSMDHLEDSIGVHEMTSMPLINVEYNLMRFSHRFIKRLMDIAVATVGLFTLYPFVSFSSKPASPQLCSLHRFIRALPRVLSGSLSLVGYPENSFHLPADAYLGKPGLTGVVQLCNQPDMPAEEQLKLTLHYNRNHSLFLDLEILFRTAVHYLEEWRLGRRKGE